MRFDAPVYSALLSGKIKALLDLRSFVRLIYACPQTHYPGYIIDWSMVG